MAPPISSEVQVGQWHYHFRVLQSVERDCFQSQVSVVQTKDRELAEAQQQLRSRRVSVKSLLVASEIVLTSLFLELQVRNSYFYPVRGRKRQVRQRLMLQ